MLKDISDSRIVGHRLRNQLQQGKSVTRRPVQDCTHAADNYLLLSVRKKYSLSRYLCTETIYVSSSPLIAEMGPIMLSQRALPLDQRTKVASALYC
ncbi:hypothetical protein AVEN_242179-1 [Araneus ventricosus]|uniref:Uncharacterized protein n=1 Tax=Araneus ventricosus TaxID=182803 RepID=A0A4Y2DEP4_ARAVE|nr:hypothetical protein AVEN_242179-1 [Araneus ventricosus]